jgi:hypothetical protein
VLLAVGEFVSVLTPGAGTSTGARVGILWSGQALAGIGAAVLFPTSLAMVAAGTHTVRSRARGTSGWSDGLVISGFIVAAIFLLLFIAVERRSAAAP